MALPPVLLVRHAPAIVSDAEPPGAWPLSEAGRRDASVLAGRLSERFPGTLDSIMSSGERKAIETAAEIAGTSPSIDDRFGEVGKPWYQSSADHEADAIRYLRGSEVSGWEPQNDAVRRFDTAVAEIADRFVVIATHGTVMSLWLATRLDALDPVSFWLDLRLPDAHLLQRDDAADRWTIERI